MIERLRNEIEQAIENFTENNRVISPERQNDIDSIRNILTSNNPLKVREKLLQYVEGLSSGWTAFWPFLEVNRFKSGLKCVLDSPAYQENAILKAMVFEAGILLNRDTITNYTSDQSIISRVEKLEDSLVLQQTEMGNLQKEISRLKTENRFLIQNLSILSKKNAALEVENSQLKDENQSLAQDLQHLNEEYDSLVEENHYLKSQLAKYSSGKEPSRLISSDYRPQNKTGAKNAYIKYLKDMPPIPLCKKEETSLSEIILKVK